MATPSATVNTTVSDETITAPAIRTKIPLTLRSDGWYSLPATVNGTDTELLLSLKIANMLLSCKDASDRRCLTPKQCHNVTGTSLQRFDNFTCAVLSDDTATLALGAFTTSRMHPGMAAFNYTTDDVAFPPSDVGGVLGLGLVDELDTPRRSTSDDVLGSQWDNFSLSLADSDPFLLVNGIDSELVARDKLILAEVRSTPSASGWTPDCGGLIINGETYPDLPSTYSCLWQNNAYFEPSYPYIAIGQTMLDTIIKDWQHWPCKPAPPRRLGEYTGKYFVCDASFQFPPLGFVFGDTTFFVPGDKYTRSMSGEGHPDKVELLLVAKDKMVRDQRGVWLGRPFLAQYYAFASADTDFLGLYCQDGVTCKPTNFALQENANASSGLSGLELFAVIAACVVVVVGIATGLFIRHKRKGKQKQLPLEH